MKRLHAEVRRELGGEPRRGRLLSRPAVGEAIELDLMNLGPRDRWVTRIAILGRARGLGYAPEIDRLELVIRDLEALGVLEVSSVGVRLTHAGIVWQRAGWASSSLPRRARKRGAS